MSKLLKLKAWLTVEDAAKRLSISAGEEITKADILRLALDSHLTLSVYFVNHTTARCGEVVSYEQTEWKLHRPILAAVAELLTQLRANAQPEVFVVNPTKLQMLLDEASDEELAECIPLMSSLNIDDERYINLEEKVSSIEGVWDLAMIGGEQIDIEQEYQRLTGGPFVTLQTMAGIFVSRPGEEICQLQERWKSNGHQKYSNEPDSERYYPASELPKDAVLVVRTAALQQLEEKLLTENCPPEKPLDPRERATFERLVYVLANETTKFGPGDATALQTAAELLGIHITGKGTIAKYLSAAFQRGEREQQDIGR